MERAGEARVNGVQESAALFALSRDAMFFEKFVASPAVSFVSAGGEKFARDGVCRFDVWGKKAGGHILPNRIEVVSGEGPRKVQENQLLFGRETRDCVTIPLKPTETFRQKTLVPTHLHSR